VVVITGASAGGGRATVRVFAGEGASIGLLARGADGLSQAAAEVERAGGRAVPLQVDVGAHGRFGSRSSNLSPQTWANEHLLQLFDGAAAAFAIGWVVRSAYERYPD
jgi:NADP-dependent 3-hydroxy acid dehydrogenase YdfG